MNERHSEKHNKEARRARLISQAMLMAQVKEVAKDEKSGVVQLVVLDVKVPQSVRMGTELAIRRGTGIIGRLSVSNISRMVTFLPTLYRVLSQVGKLMSKQVMNSSSLPSRSSFSSLPLAVTFFL